MAVEVDVYRGGFLLFDGATAQDNGEGPEYPVLWESGRIDAPIQIIRAMAEGFCRAVGVEPIEFHVESFDDEQPAQAWWRRRIVRARGE